MLYKNMHMDSSRISFPLCPSCHKFRTLLKLNSLLCFRHSCLLTRWRQDAEPHCTGIGLARILIATVPGLCTMLLVAQWEKHGETENMVLGKSLTVNQPRSAHTHLPSTGDELMLEPDSIPQFTHAVLPLPTMYQAFSNTLSLRQIKQPELPASEFAAALRIELRKHDCTRLEQRRPKSK